MPDPRTTPDPDDIDRKLDDQLDDTFPASDPPSITQPHHPDAEDPA